MKNPNHYGSIAKLPGNRRNPYRVTITEGWELNNVTGKKRQIRQTIGYYPSHIAAVNALAEYNKNPWDASKRNLLFSEVYEKWSKEAYPKLSEGSVAGYKAAYTIAKPLHNVKMLDIDLDLLEKTAYNSGKNYPSLRNFKGLLSQMFQYAVKHDIVPPERNKVQFLQLDKDANPNRHTKEIFTRQEVDKLWKHTDIPYCNVVLMLIYGGYRIEELLELKKADVHMDEQWVDIVASKTAAGVRKVPIADKVYSFYEYWYNLNDSEYLISTPSGGHFEYRNFRRNYWLPVMEELEMNHLPHEARHTCITLLTEAGIDERIIQKIVGHQGKTVTENVYTHLDISTLLHAVNAI